MKLYKYLIFIIISVFSFAKDDYFIITQILEKGKPVTKDSKCYILRKETKTFMANQYSVTGEITEFKENQEKNNDLQFRYRLQPEDVIQIANPNVEIVLKRGSQVVKLKMANNYNTYWKVPALGKPIEKVDVETKVLYSSKGKDGKIEKVTFGPNEKKVSLSVKGTTYEVYDGEKEAVIKLLDGEIEIEDENGNIKKVNPGEYISWGISKGIWVTGKLSKEELDRLKAETAYSDESSEKVYNIPDNLSVEEYKLKGQEAEKYETAGLAELYYRKALEKLEKEKPDRSKWTEDEYMVVIYLSRILQKLNSTVDAIEFLEEYFKSQSKDSEKRVSIFYRELGYLYCTVGETQKALEYYLKDIDLWKILYLADTGNNQKARELSISYNNLGYMYARIRENPKALEYYIKSLELRENLYSADKENSKKAQDLSRLYDRLGNIYIKIRKEDKALEYYIKSLDLRETIYNSDKGNSEKARDLSISYNNLGDIYIETRNTPKALEYYIKGSEIFETLHRADKGNSEKARDLTFSYNKLGDIYIETGDIQKALEYYIKSLDLSENLYSADKRNSEKARDLTFSYNKLGDIYIETGDTQKALEYYIKGLEIAEALYSADRGNSEKTRDLTISYYDLGKIYQKIGDTQKALKCYIKGLEIAEALYNADKGNSKKAIELSIYYNFQGDRYVQIGETQKALDYYLKELMLSDAIYQLDKENREKAKNLSRSFGALSEIENFLENNKLSEAYFTMKNIVYFNYRDKEFAEAYIKLGDAILDSGNKSKAKYYYEKGLEITEELYASNPVYSTSIDLNNSYYKLFVFHLNNQEYQQAEFYIRKRTELIEKFLTEDPKNKTKQKDLARSYGSIGWVLILQEKYKEAQEYLLKTNKLLPNNYAALVNVGHTYLFTGDETKAQEYYEETIKNIKNEDELMKNGPISDFDLFIENGWDVEKCKKWKQWFLEQWEIKKEGK